MPSGSFRCKGASIPPGKAGSCDLCRHVVETDSIKSPWDGRTLKINRRVTCTTPNIVYCIRCTLHEGAWIIGSSVSMPERWRNYRKDFISKSSERCGLSKHAAERDHPNIVKRQPIPFLEVILLDAVDKNDRDQLLCREVFWQTNVGTLKFGLNERKDFITVAKRSK